MTRVVLCVIAVLIGVGGAAGMALALYRPVAAVVITAAGCDRVSAAYGLVSEQAALAVRADACGSLGRTALLSERASFDVLGAAAWRTPGPSLDRVEIGIDRSADRPPGRRTFVLTADQASERWGSRPVVASADQARTVRAVLNDVLWTCGCAVAVLSLAVVMAAVGRVLLRSGVVVIWLR